MRILVTGIAGFVGKHLTEHLIKEGKHEILGVDLRFDDLSTKNFYTDEHQSKIKFLEADLTDRKKVSGIIKKFNPQQVYHLAAQSSVSYSWGNPIETFKVNVFGGINILESLKDFCPQCRVLVVCTAEEYGEVNDKERAINEDFKIYPTNPYAISKAALDFFSTTYYKANKLPVFVSRSFNHIGQGQSERFVTSDFAKQIAEIESGLREPVIRVGNVEVTRDFLDVRDVVKAYKCIIDRGEAGQVYNVCSGKKYKISDLLDTLISLSTKTDIKVRVDRSKLRPVDVNAIYGNNSKLKLHTGWYPKYNIKVSLKDTLDYWRRKINTRTD